MKNIIIMAAVAAVTLITSCEKDKENVPVNGIVYGPEVQVGNGKARSFFEPDGNNNPLTMGFIMDEEAVNNLPANETSFVLQVPQQVKATTPYNHISLDWTPHGHGPSPIYDKPHFDMHFYMIEEAEKNAIDVANPALNILPDSAFLPTLYFAEPGGNSKMGKHWADLTSPELNPAKPVPFTSTFIYGSYNGKVIFHEPMVTRAFLLTKPDTLMAIRQPKKFAKPGSYPTKYQVKFDAAKKQWRIVLRDFTLVKQH